MDNAPKTFSNYKAIFSMKFSGLLLFFREIFSNPLAIGAVCPSSKRLATAIATQIPIELSGKIIELGPGTGVVTQALLEHGINPEKLVAIERSNMFVKHLIKKFPQLTVIEGDAKDLAHLLTEDATVSVIVSGLPLRSLPEGTVKSILGTIDKVLADGGLFIQFTYFYGSKGLSLPQSFHRIYSKRIFLNFPPARIDVFSHKASENLYVSTH